MIDELPGFSSDTASHEDAISAAVGDGWEIKGFSITHIAAVGQSAADTYKECLLWKTDPPPDPTLTDEQKYGKKYWPLRKKLKDAAAKRFGRAP